MVLHRIANPDPSGCAGSIPARGVDLLQSGDKRKVFIVIFSENSMTYVEERKYEGFVGLRVPDVRGRNTQWVGPYDSAEAVKENLEKLLREKHSLVLGLEAPGIAMMHGKDLFVYGIFERGEEELTPVDVGIVRGFGHDSKIEFISNKKD